MEGRKNYFEKTLKETFLTLAAHVETCIAAVGAVGVPVLVVERCPVLPPPV